MRVLLISDIHSNLIALDAVLAAAKSGSGFSQTWVLGDIVGYGPAPMECVNRLKTIGAIVVAGNHDLACSGAVGVDLLTGSARAAAEWTKQQLDPGASSFLASQPLTRVMGEFTLVHGSTWNPAQGYVLAPGDADAVFEHLETRHCVAGHSHRQLLFREGMDGRASAVGIETGKDISIADARFFINPGSVGQPRDGDWRAAYAILDTVSQSVAFHRAEYDVDAVERRMKEAGLPGVLAARMKAGTARTSFERWWRRLTGGTALARLRTRWPRRGA